MDSEWCQLRAQGFRYPLERKLAPAIERDAREASHASHRCHIHDEPATPLPEARDERLGDGNRSKHIDVELVTQLVHRGFFDDSLVTVACVVDQDIDGAMLCFGAFNDARYGVEIGHVEDDWFRGWHFVFQYS